MTPSHVTRSRDVFDTGHGLSAAGSTPQPQSPSSCLTDRQKFLYVGILPHAILTPLQNEVRSDGFTFCMRGRAQYCNDLFTPLGGNNLCQIRHEIC